MTDSTTSQNKDKVSTAKPKAAKVSLLRRKSASSSHYGKHAGAEHEDGPLQRKPMLQRTCACGQHTIGGSTCSACRQQRLGGANRSSHNQGSGGEQPLATVISHNHLDLSRVPVNLITPSIRATGGEGAGDDDQEAMIGGESKQFGQTISQRLGQTVQRNGEGSTATLNFTTVTAPKNKGCGGFRDQVRWSLDGADESTQGFVVQKVTFDLVREKCDGGDANLQITYWEAWQVRDGEVFIGTSESRHNADTFNVPSKPDHKGSCYEAGWAKFMPDYEAPNSWGNVPMARALPSTTSEPDKWSDSGTSHRYMRNTFDCCGQSDLGEFESGGSSSG
jgi:hypothetical protein